MTTSPPSRQPKRKALPTKMEVKQSPRLLLSFAPQESSEHGHAKWLDALKAVAEQPAHVSKVLSKHYHTLAPQLRAKAAVIIAGSASGDHMTSPDATYLYAWLHHSLLNIGRQVDYSGLGQGPVGGMTASVLSAWLREQPSLCASLAAGCGEAFNQTHLYSYPAHTMERMLNSMVPRKYRTATFYVSLLETLPQLLPVAAMHLDETACLRQLDSAQCKLAATIGWDALYPTSVRSASVNAALNTMATLDVYDTMFLRASLALEPPPQLDTLQLPSDLAPMS